MNEEESYEEEEYREERVVFSEWDEWRAMDDARRHAELL